MGINNDDAALELLVSEIGLTLQSYLDLLGQIDPQQVTEDDLSQLEAIDLVFQDQYSQFEALEPSVTGWRNQEEALNTQVWMPMKEVTHLTLNLHLGQLEADAEGVVPPFGLASLTMGMAMQSSLRFRWPTRCTERPSRPRCHEQFDCHRVDLWLPPVGNIEVTWFQLSSSTVNMLPGYDGYLYGSGFQKIRV